MTRPTTDQDQLIDQLVCELAAQFEAGELPDLATYEGDYPELAERLRRLWPTFQAMANLGHFQRSDPAALPRRGTLGDFEIIREVGRGGMGVVFEAEQISLSRRVALKVLPFAAVLDRTQLQRFKNETQVAACLTHQNIVPIYAVGCERSVHFYAMQYIEGRTLAEFIASHFETTNGDVGIADGVVLSDDKSSAKASRELVETRALADESTIVTEPQWPDYYRKVAGLVAQAAGALHYAHGQGVVHRDIKPANLILDERGKLWVSDFGLAYVNTQQSLTMTGDLIGTLRYMSPEQAAGRRLDLDHRTDIYSLGITLYELLARCPAFADEDRQRLLRRITEEEPPLPRSVHRSIPRDLETIVLKAISKKPSSRYQTMVDFQDDLRRFLEDKPVRARRASWSSRAMRWCRHNRLAMSLGVMFLLLVMTMAFAWMNIVASADEALSLHVVARNLDGYDVSAEGSHLARIDWVTGDVAVADLTNGKQWQLTTRGNWNLPESEQQYGEGCVWSPGGTMVAYQWIMHDAHEVRVAGIDGTGKRTLLRKENAYYLEPMSWSADGRWILVGHRLENGYQQLLLVSVTDGSEKIIQTSAERPPGWAELSPSGRYVVFHRKPASDALRDIYVLDTDSEEVVRVVDHPANDAFPEWTPDGRWIVFVSDRRGHQGLWTQQIVNGRSQGEPHLVHQLTGHILPFGIRRNGSYYFQKNEFDRDLYTAEIDFEAGAVTKEVAQVPTQFDGVNSHGAYSPDGKRLAWIVRSASTREAGRLWIRDFDTGQTRDIAVRHPSLSTLWIGVRWRPDGNSVVVCGSTTQPYGCKYYLIDTTSGRIDEFLPDIHAEFSNKFDLSKDGRHLYFVEYKSRLEGHGQGRIIRLDLQTKQQIPLHSSSEGHIIRNLALSPDGAQLAFSTQRSLYVMPAVGGPVHRIHQTSDSQRIARLLACAWAADGDSLLVGMTNTSFSPVSLWQVFTDNRESRPLGITMPLIAGLSIHPDGQRVLFGSRGKNSGCTLYALDNLMKHLSVLD